MNYPARWMLSVALERGYPSLTETGDVSIDETPPAEDTKITWDPASIRASLETASRQLRMVIGVSVGIGVLAGGVAGYFIGRTRR